LRFQISEKWANLRFPLNIQKQKCVSASGGLRPPDPRPKALPLDPAGGSAPRPRYRLALHALAMAPLCQILNTPLALYTTLKRGFRTTRTRNVRSGRNDRFYICVSAAASAAFIAYESYVYCVRCLHTLHWMETALYTGPIETFRSRPGRFAL